MHKARVTVTARREVLAKQEKGRREDLAALLTEMKAENGPATAGVIARRW